MGRAAEEVTSGVGRRLALRAGIARRGANTVLEGGQVGTEAGPQPREVDARYAGEKLFLRIDAGRRDGAAEDAVRRVAGNRVAYNFGVNVAENAPKIGGGDETRRIDEALDDREAFGPKSLLHIPRPRIDRDFRMVYVVRLQRPSEVLSREKTLVVLHGQDPSFGVEMVNRRRGVAAGA